MTLSIQGIRLPWTVIQAGVELVFITRPVLKSQSQNQMKKDYLLLHMTHSHHEQVKSCELGNNGRNIVLTEPIPEP